MPRYVAFLRAINVGGHNVKMDRLRALFEELKLANVETFIASGNVIFDSSAKQLPKLEQRIAAHLEAALGYEVATIIRSVDEVDQIARRDLFAAGELAAAAAHTVLFLQTAPSKTVQQAVAAIQTEHDHFILHDRELHWLSRRRLGESSDSMKLLNKALHPLANTARNITTIRKLASKYPQ